MKQDSGSYSQITMFLLVVVAHYEESSAAVTAVAIAWTDCNRTIQSTNRSLDIP